jgi:hypothetical protein
METEGSLQCSNALATTPCLKPEESSFLVLFFPILISSSHLLRKFLRTGKTMTYFLEILASNLGQNREYLMGLVVSLCLSLLMLE